MIAPPSVDFSESLIARDSVSKMAQFDTILAMKLRKKKFSKKVPKKIFESKIFFFEDCHNNKQTILHLPCESRFLSRTESHGPSDRESP